MYSSAKVNLTRQFNPRSIPNMAAWWDAASAQMTSAYADGGVVGTFYDISGNGYHATQSTAGYKPLYYKTTSPVNGKPYLVFDNTDDGLETALTLTPPFSIVLVERPQSSAFVSIRTLLATPPNNSLISIARTQSNNAYNQGTVSNSYITNDGNPHIAILNAPSGSACSYFLDAVDHTDASTNGATWTNLLFGQGSLGVPGEVANTHVCEVVCYNKILATNERTRLQKYMSQKWGISL